VKPGEVVAGYQIEAALGEGAMGAVFRARHLATQQAVAIKVLHPGADLAARERFAREGLAMGRLNHPHLLGVHTALEGLGEPALVLEYAGRGSLAKRLEAGPLEPQEAIPQLAQLASGLAAAHAAGILHRDLKPENVLFDEEGRPKLADFGLARIGGEERLTATHEVLGTPLYMAPEQARGEVPSEAVDVYALGAVLYHCLAGRPPLLPGASLLELLQRLQSEEPPRLGSLGVEVPDRVEAICRRCLTKDPQLRPSAVELAQELEAWDEEGSRAELVLPLKVVLAGLAIVATLLLGLLVSRLGAPESVAPSETPARSASLAPSPSPMASAPPVEFGWPDLGPAAVSRAPRGSVLLEAAASLSAVDSLALNELYRRAGRSAVLVEDRDDRALSAALLLARRGYTYGLVRLAIHKAPINPSQRLPEESRRWLDAAARLGDSEALYQLGISNEFKHGDRDLALAYRFLGVATRPLRNSNALENDLGRGSRAPELREVTVAKAWRDVWRVRRPVADPNWRRARRELSEDPARAVESYLVLLERSSGAQREALAEELTRAAELAWVPLLEDQEWTPRLVALHMARVSPSTLSLQQARAQAQRVLRRVRWCRGVLLELEFEIQTRGWGSQLKPPEWVVAGVKEALRLRPGSPLAQVARFRANLWRGDRALSLALEAYTMTRRDRDRAQLRDAMRYLVGVAYRQRWTTLAAARQLAMHLPGNGTPAAFWTRLEIEHRALRRGETERAPVEGLRADFRARLDGWSEKILSEEQRLRYLRRLERLQLRRGKQGVPSPTPR
jgi:serine/threonine protein kinase